MLQDLIKKLSAPIDYQWRVQSRTKDRSKAICSAYIDARDVMNVLDANCVWESTFKEVSGFIFAGIRIWDEQGNSYVRWDAGQRIENNPEDQMYDQAGKSAASDAFKRAAVMWGIGRFLYDLPMVTVPCDQYGNPVDANGNRIWDLTKHINEKNTVKVGANSFLNTGTGNITYTTLSPEPPKSANKPVLDQQKYDAMVKFIAEGKISEVESAIKKYTLNESQTKLLTTMINQAKAQAITKAAKK